MDNWREYEKILIGLAKRKGSKYDSAWYGEYWDGLFSNGGQAWFTCLICGEQITSYPISSLVNARLLMTKDAEKHGMKHLKESNLLPFV